MDILSNIILSAVSGGGITLILRLFITNTARKTNEYIKVINMLRVDNQDIKKVQSLMQAELENLKNTIHQKDKQMALLEASNVDDVPLAYWLKDLHGNYIYANDEFCELFDKKLADVIGKTDLEIFPEHAEHIRNTDLKLLQSKDDAIYYYDTITSSCIIVKWKRYAGAVVTNISGYALRLPQQ
jgi:PAS domain-containing protein